MKLKLKADRRNPWPPAGELWSLYRWRLRKRPLLDSHRIKKCTNLVKQGSLLGSCDSRIVWFRRRILHRIKSNISQFEIYRQVSRNIFALMLNPARLEEHFNGQNNASFIERSDWLTRISVTITIWRAGCFDFSFRRFREKFKWWTWWKWLNWWRNQSRLD